MLIHVTIIDHSNCHARIVEEFEYDDEATNSAGYDRVKSAMDKVATAHENGHSVSTISAERYASLAFYPSGFRKGETSEATSPTWAGRNTTENKV